MNNLAQSVVSIIFQACIYVALPAAIIWGWVRWYKRPQPRSLSIVSLVGFALATASALLAASSIIYAREIGGFPYNDPLLSRIYGWGALLSFSGLVSGLIGVWRPGPLRWHAPACAFAILFFWFAVGMSE
jgi:hypothetical protein